MLPVPIISVLPAQNKNILPFYLIQRISRGLAHEITQTTPTIYIHSVSHGVNVDKKIEKNRYFLKKSEKKLGFRSQKTFVIDYFLLTTDYYNWLFQISSRSATLRADFGILSVHRGESWLLFIWIIFSMFSVLSVAEQRTPSHGDFIGILQTFCITVRIIGNRFM